MTNYFQEALQLKDKMIENRRHLHQIPEVGLELPETKAFVKGKLEALGLTVKEYGESGLSVLIEGEKGPGKCLLIRADMDALPMKEESGLPFSATGDKAHACGHDVHTAIALGTVELLLAHRADFKGSVKFMFQPAEEIFKGSYMMIENGILEDPKVDVAIGLHTSQDDVPHGFSYNEGYVTTSSDNFKITVTGRGGHGAYPHLAIDSLDAAVKIYQSFNDLIAREVPAQDIATLTFGQLAGGTNANIIPETTVLQGTFRTYNPEIRQTIKERIDVILESIAKATSTQIDLEYVAGVPSLMSNPELTHELVEYIRQANNQLTIVPDVQIMASEDFAFVAERVPATFFMLHTKVEGNDRNHHDPRIQFNEDAMTDGVGIFATSAINWLNNN